MSLFRGIFIFTIKKAYLGHGKVSEVSLFLGCPLIKRGFTVVIKTRLYNHLLGAIKVHIPDTYTCIYVQPIDTIISYLALPLEVYM